MTYLHIPMSTRKAPTDEQIATFMSAVDAEGAVYVHCVGGKHRTGVMTAIYRMTKDGLTAEQAFKEMKHNKLQPGLLHPEFKKFVYQYEPKATAAAVATSCLSSRYVGEPLASALYAPKEMAMRTVRLWIRCALTVSLIGSVGCGARAKLSVLY